jgi:hypothetical protein
MNETIESSVGNHPAGNQRGDPPQTELANAMKSWKENLKDNFFIVLLVSAGMSFLVGYFICQQLEAEKREQWAEILFRQVKKWLTERSRDTADSVEQGLEYARSAAERAADTGAEYSRRLNPFRREARRRFFGIF